MSCNLCLNRELIEVINVGNIPVAHIMTKKANQETFAHSMRLHQCGQCGLVQIVDPVDPEILYSGYNFNFSSWKSNPHMKPEIESIKRLSGKYSPKIFEIGCNEGDFLNKLKSNGITSLAAVEPNPVVAKNAEKLGVKIFNTFFSEKTSKEIEKETGKFDFIVSRQVVEHIPNLQSLMQGVKNLLVDGGHIMFEVPDFEIPVKFGDCSALWEEHVNYFNFHSMQNLLTQFGFSVLECEKYDFSGGAVVVYAVNDGRGARLTGPDIGLDTWKNEVSKFRERFEDGKKTLLKEVEQQKSLGKKVALYGSGCRANMLFHALGLENLVDCIVDDQEDKQGYHLGHSSIEIVDSSILREGKWMLLLAVNSENEAKVTHRNSDIKNRGGVFFSLNSPSENFLKTF